MQRLIKFRGQDEDKNWHFGNYDQDNQEIFYTHTDDIGIYRVAIPIIPDSVGQFTGVYDSYGKEIFEGDIIQNQEYPELIYCVEMIGGCWSVDYHEDDDFDSVALNWLLTMAPFKVIGNIFDNPELERDV